MSMSRESLTVMASSAEENCNGSIGLILSQAGAQGSFPSVVGVEAWSPLLDEGVQEGDWLVEVLLPPQ